MNDLTAEQIRVMPGREILSLVIQLLDQNADETNRLVGKFGADRLGMSYFLHYGLANALRHVLTRGSIPLDTRPGKDGAPTFISKIRHETEGEYARQFAEALRSSLLQHFPPVGSKIEEIAA